jgi:pimeloyl-ACP methyl ester carboxylesterase
MVKQAPVLGPDLRGVNRLTIDGISGTIGLVEAMQQNIASLPAVLGGPKRRGTTGITRFVYRGIQAGVGLVGSGLDRLLAKIEPLLLVRLEPLLGRETGWPGREPLLAALNGVLGDHLAESHNPLAIAMCFRRGGMPLQIDRQALATAIPQAGSKLLVLLHGLCMNDLQWKRKGHDHGAALAGDLGYTPVYLHYNSGLHVSRNGRALAELLESLVQQWPVPLTELVIIGHSMGGLVARSACRYGELAQHRWRQQLDKLVFLGTPHHGASLERGGNWVDTLLGASRYSAPLARLGKIRSAGITDLRFGYVVDEDWNRRGRFAPGGDRRRPLPLPKGVACYCLAATTGRKAGDLGDRLLGDGIVPLASALGQHANPRLALTFDASRQWVSCRTSHLDLLSRPAVYAQIRRWLTTAG